MIDFKTKTYNGRSKIRILSLIPARFTIASCAIRQLEVIVTLTRLIKKTTFIMRQYIGDQAFLKVSFVSDRFFLLKLRIEISSKSIFLSEPKYKNT